MSDFDYSTGYQIAGIIIFVVRTIFLKFIINLFFSSALYSALSVIWVLLFSYE